MPDGRSGRGGHQRIRVGRFLSRRVREHNITERNRARVTIRIHGDAHLHVNDSVVRRSPDGGAIEQWRRDRHLGKRLVPTAGFRPRWSRGPAGGDPRHGAATGAPANVTTFPDVCGRFRRYRSAPAGSRLLRPHVVRELRGRQSARHLGDEQRIDHQPGRKPLAACCSLSHVGRALSGSPREPASLRQGFGGPGPTC
jgi:hypothetical protein